jgi:hypothetical protein
MTKEKIQFRGINREIISWKSETTQQLQIKIGMLTSEGKDRLISQIKGYVNHDPDGSIYSMSWKFPKHGVFVIQGVGRGYVLVDGKVKRGVMRGNSFYSISDTIERHPKDWFNPVIDQRMPELTEKVANYYADKAADQIESVEAKRLKNFEYGNY